MSEMYRTLESQALIFKETTTQPQRNERFTRFLAAILLTGIVLISFDILVHGGHHLKDVKAITSHVVEDSPGEFTRHDTIELKYEKSAYSPIDSSIGFQSHCNRVKTLGT